jgi:hypothetical protein
MMTMMMMDSESCERKAAVALLSLNHGWCEKKYENPSGWTVFLTRFERLIIK